MLISLVSSHSIHFSINKLTFLTWILSIKHLIWSGFEWSKFNRIFFHFVIELYNNCHYSYKKCKKTLTDALQCCHKCHNVYNFIILDVLCIINEFITLSRKSAKLKIKSVDCLKKNALLSGAWKKFLFLNVHWEIRMIRKKTLYGENPW